MIGKLKERPDLKVIERSRPLDTQNLFFLIDEADRALRIKRARSRLKRHIQQDNKITWIDFRAL